MRLSGGAARALCYMLLPMLNGLKILNRSDLGCRSWQSGTLTFNWMSGHPTNGIGMAGVLLVCLAVVCVWCLAAQA